MNLWADILEFHKYLLCDTKERLPDYRRALSETMRPGDVVLDLGTGTGLLAFFACQMGAQRVYAVEMGQVIELARLLCRKNGLQDRVIFVPERSSEVEAPERVDVLVSDIYGTFGLQDGGLAALIDARARWLKEDGAIIPRAIELFIAPVEVPDFYYQKIDCWAEESWGLDLSPVRSFAANQRYPVRLEHQAFLGKPVSLTRLHVARLTAPAIQTEVSLVADRRGMMHGLCGWFAAELADDLRISNAPTTTTTNYAQTFFPLARPVPLEEGSRLRVALSSFDDRDWRWRVQVDEGTEVFDHSTLWGFPLSKALLQKESSLHAPALTRRGEAELSLLRSFDGVMPIGELEQTLFRTYPDCFRSLEDAAAFVRAVVRRCA